MDTVGTCFRRKVGAVINNKRDIILMAQG